MTNDLAHSLLNIQIILVAIFLLARSIRWYILCDTGNHVIQNEKYIYFFVLSKTLIPSMWHNRNENQHDGYTIVS